MPIFRLKPVPALLGELAWQNSPYQGELWANAATEAEARGLASGRYEDAGANIPGVSRSASPWLDPRLVQVTAEPEGPGGQDVPIGVVMGDRQL